MTSTRYDPRPNEPYGVCLTCDMTLDDGLAADKHMSDTTPVGGRSHSTRTTNPTRKQRVQRAIDSIIEDAIADALDEVLDLTDEHITRSEARAALFWHPDFLDALEKDQ